MKISYELDLNNFKAWSGAVDTLNRIRREGKTEELESILEELYPDGMDETELNDLLWFEPDLVFEWVGLPTESSINAEIEEVKEELSEKEENLEDLMAEYHDACIGIADWECKEVWEDDYKDDVNDLKEEISELKERISELEEELEEI
jgi:hypothetical protein